MSFSYNPDAPEPRDFVRLGVTDTNPALFMFHDSELDMLLTLADGDVTAAAVHGLRLAAADAAKTAIYYQLSGLSVDRRSVGQHLRDLADKLETAGRIPFELISVASQGIDRAGRDVSEYDSGRAGLGDDVMTELLP